MQRTHAVAIATVAIMVAGLAFALDEKQEYGNCVVVTDRDYFTDKATRPYHAMWRHRNDRPAPCA